jgi:glutaconate CoA-transferase, subunit B
MSITAGSYMGPSAGAKAVETGYTRAELMVVSAARALRDGEAVFVGIGLPNLACNLAKRLHAPRLELVYESGVFGAAPERQALSIGDPCLVSGAAAVCSLPDLFLFYLQGGRIDVGFLGGAQVDRYGNLNTTVIGSYDHPKVRLPGSGGAADIAAMAARVFIIGRQSPRSFVERVEFVTSPGHVPACGRLPGTSRRGPELVMTDLGVYGFACPTGSMSIRSLHPGVTFEEAQLNTGWSLERPDSCEITAPPTAEELRLLREELDPKGYYLKAGA